MTLYHYSSIAIRIRQLTGAHTSWDLFRAAYAKMQVSSPGRRFKCLDLGCGEGKSFLEYGVELGGIELHLVDQQPRINDRDLMDRSNVYIYAMDMLRFLEALPDESVDFILVQDVLEHLRSDHALSLLNLCRSKLRKQGVLFGRVPNGNSPFSLRNQNNDITHVTYWGNRALAGIAISAGFPCAEIRGTYEILPGRFGFVRSIVTRAVIEPILSFLLMPYIGWSRDVFWTANICIEAIKK